MSLTDTAIRAVKPLELIMPITPQETITAIMAYWQRLADENAPNTMWRKNEQPPTGWDAVGFFVEVMLNQRQSEKRACNGAEEFVTRSRGKRWSPRTMWTHISEMTLPELRSFCTFSADNKCSYTGSYAGINADRFTGQHHKRGWLRTNADRIINMYRGYVENIWMDDLPDDNAGKILRIHERFQELAGIGDNLANMAVFQLVRYYGYAGGKESKKLLKMKFDTHVNRVLTRAIISGNEELGSAENYVRDVLNNVGISPLDSPADFDFAVYSIGQDYCQYGYCGKCPIHEQCNIYQKKRYR